MNSFNMYNMTCVIVLQRSVS